MRQHVGLGQHRHRRGEMLTASACAPVAFNWVTAPARRRRAAPLASAVTLSTPRAWTALGQYRRNASSRRKPEASAAMCGVRNIWSRWPVDTPLNVGCSTARPPDNAEPSAAPAHEARTGTGEQACGATEGNVLNCSTPTPASRRDDIGDDDHDGECGLSSERDDVRANAATKVATAGATRIPGLGAIKPTIRPPMTNPTVLTSARNTVVPRSARWTAGPTARRGRSEASY
jgi:hypothetical protein